MGSFHSIQTETLNSHLRKTPLANSDYILNLVVGFQEQAIVEDLIQYYFETLQSLLEIQGAHYRYPLLAIDYHCGSMTRSVYSHEFTIDLEFWGEITLFRTSELSPSEHQQIKFLNTLLASSLKSKIIQESANLTSEQGDIIGLIKPQLAEQLITREAKIALREKTPISVILLDIDRFDRIVEFSGKLHRDKLLYEVMQKIHQTIRETDLLVRFHRDSFCIILKDTSGKNAILVSERIRILIDQSIFIDANKKPLHMTMSAGIVELSASDSLDAIFKRAKGALQFARVNGRNQSRLADGLKVVA